MFLYKQYDQALLNQQYNNRYHVPDFADYFECWEMLSQQAQNKLAVIKDISYGGLPREKLDVFPSSSPNTKTLVFIHGGYWQMLDKNMFSFIANSFHSYGITTVLINYPLAPEYSVNQIVSSCRLALSWIHNNISNYNGNSNDLYIVGHSAGAHLAAMLLTAGEGSMSSDEVNSVKGACLISGLFNLLPIQLSYLNSVLQLNKKSALQNSPVKLEPINHCPVVIAVGANETNEFKDQSIELSENWEGKNIPIQFLQLANQNHFSIVDSLCDAHSILHLSIAALMACSLKNKVG